MTEVVHSNSDESENRGADHVTIVHEGGSGVGMILAIVALIAIVAAGVWLFTSSRTVDPTDASIAEAANKVGNAAEQVGNAVDEAASRVK